MDLSQLNDQQKAKLKQASVFHVVFLFLPVESADNGWLYATPKFKTVHFFALKVSVRYLSRLTC